MMRYILYDPEGTILSFGSASTERNVRANARDGNEVLIISASEDRTRGADYYIVDLEGSPRIAERPSIPAYSDGTAPRTLDMDVLPSGSTVTATNNAGDSVQTSDVADPVELVSAGVYEIRIDPPFPYKPRQHTLVVRDA